MTNGVFALIFNKRGEILLLKRDNKARFQGWNLPGGRVEYGEALKQALIREVTEETGLIITVSSLLGFYDKKLKGQILDRAFLFFGQIIGGDLRTGEENQEWGWFANDHLPQKIVQVPCDGFPKGRMIQMILDGFKEKK